MPLTAGSHGAYEWLSADLDLTEFLQSCPEVAVDRYLAVTSNDSGPMALTEREKAEGWIEIGEIAYSPRLLHSEGLPHPLCGYFNEWYLFGAPARQLDAMSRGNAFESKLEPGEVFAFVNYYLFLPSHNDVTGLFWKQLDWIQPESYVSDTEGHLTFVTRNRELFMSVQAKLEDHSRS
jgi:hypothetical protein